jgi:hypothetical protein
MLLAAIGAVAALACQSYVKVAQISIALGFF